MCTILLSIKPEYVERILSGEKRFEYRRKCASRRVSKILIYETTPKMKIVGEVEVNGVLSLTPEELWSKTSDFAGISHEKFMAYFSKRDNAYAYQLGKVLKFEREKSLTDYGIKAPPQSFVYM